MGDSSLDHCYLLLVCLHKPPRQKQSKGEQYAFDCKCNSGVSSTFVYYVFDCVIYHLFVIFCYLLLACLHKPTRQEKSKGEHWLYIHALLSPPFDCNCIAGVFSICLFVFVLLLIVLWNHIGWQMTNILIKENLLVICTFALSLCINYKNYQPERHLANIRHEISHDHCDRRSWKFLWRRNFFREPLPE